MAVLGWLWQQKGRAAGWRAGGGRLALAGLEGDHTEWLF
jgi:hypothetical protein